MAYNPHSDDETDIYFTGKVEQGPEFDENVSDSTDPGYKVYYQYSGPEDEYVLPPAKQKTARADTDITPKPTKKKDVEDLYDEDHYALPDINGCVTKGRVLRNDDSCQKQPEIPSDGGRRKLSVNKMKLIGFVVLLIAVGGIGGIVVMAFTGITSLF